jgi:hypothetical protein
LFDVAREFVVAACGFFGFLRHRQGQDYSRCGRIVIGCRLLVGL